MFAFPKTRRLRKSSDFRFVFTHATRVAVAEFTLLARPNTLENPRLGLIVARKCSPKATERNRIKRLIRESFRHCDNLPAMDIVVIAKKIATEQDNSQLFKQMAKLWKRIKNQR